MKKTNIQRIVREELIKAIAEQEQKKETPPQTDKIPEDDRFSQAEKAFLGKFAEKGSQYLGILYSKSPTGIEEFINRSSGQLNLTMDVFQKLIRDGVIAIEPYGGYGRNEDYTIKLNLDLQGVEQYRGTQPPNGENDGEEAADIDAGGDSGGAPIPVPSSGGDFTGSDAETEPAGGEDIPDDAAEGGDEPAEEIPEPEEPSETILKYGDILNETARTAKRLMEQRNTMSRPEQARVYANQSRMLKRLPSGYLRYLERIIQILGKKLHTDMEREHLVADILDNMAHNFGLTPNQIMRSYIFYRTQNRLKNVIGEGVDLLSEQDEQTDLNFDFEFESGKIELSQKGKAQLSQLIAKVKNLIKRGDELRKITVIGSESKVTNQAPYTEPGSLAKARAEKLANMLKKEFPDFDIDTTSVGARGPEYDSEIDKADDSKYTKYQKVIASLKLNPIDPVINSSLIDVLYAIPTAEETRTHGPQGSNQGTVKVYSTGRVNTAGTMNKPAADYKMTKSYKSLSDLYSLVYRIATKGTGFEDGNPKPLPMKDEIVNKAKELLTVLESLKPFPLSEKWIVQNPQQAAELPGVMTPSSVQSNLYVGEIRGFDNLIKFFTAVKNKV